MINFGEVHLRVLVPGIFSGLLRSVQMLKERLGCRKQREGSYLTYSIHGNTAVMVPEFVVEYLPSAELQPWFLDLQ